MRVAALYDIHGNLPALEAVLQEVAGLGLDAVVCGGDVFPGPMGCECLHALQALDIPVHFVMGNGDREVLAARSGVVSDKLPTAFRDVMSWCAAQLSDADANTIASWHLTVRLAIPGTGQVLFCHATPCDDTTIFTRRTPDATLSAWVNDVSPATLVVCGHTHMQFDRTVRDVRIVNAGSVGLPVGAPSAYWLLLDGGVRLRQTEYDLVAAAGRVRATAYPQAATFADENILQPPTEAAMLTALSPRT